MTLWPVLCIQCICFSFPPSLPVSSLSIHKHCNVYQVTLLYDVSSWTCCFSGGLSFANPHPSHPKERRCWKTWWPLMSSWETSTLITALQVFSCQLAKPGCSEPHSFTCDMFNYTFHICLLSHVIFEINNIFPINGKMVLIISQLLNN